MIEVAVAITAAHLTPVDRSNYIRANVQKSVKAQVSEISLTATGQREATCVIQMGSVRCDRCV